MTDTDVVVYNQAEIYTLRAISPKAEKWLKDNLPPNSLVVKDCFSLLKIVCGSETGSKLIKNLKQDGFNVW